MAVITKQSFKIGFTFNCMVAVTFMIGYWFYKYSIEDRDVGMVDYIHIEDEMEFKLPAVSFCFEDVVVATKLKNANKSDYVRFLTGKSYEDDYTKIEYSNVTINLQDYLVAVQEFWRNESSGRISSTTFEQKESFSGLLSGRFMKCFMLNGAMENLRHIKKIYFYYNLVKLFADLEEDFYNHYLNTKRSMSLIVSYKIHYPGQFLDGRYFASFYLTQESIATQLYINEIELINSRNSKHRICTENVDTYDNMVIKNWLSRENCRVPYLKASNKFPRCNSSKMIKTSQFHYDSPTTLNVPSSCHRISKLQFEPEFIDNPNAKVWEPMSLWWFSIVYPDEFRIITQSKEVDIHALIGNIGGYLGLFLGISCIFK